MFPFLRRAGPEVEARLKQTVADELASTYPDSVELKGVLVPDTIRAYVKKATGTTFLIDPSVG